MTNNKNYEDSPKARSATIRTLWQEFEPWLKAHQEATQADLTRFVEKSPILPERRNDVRKLFRQEHLKYIRKAWIERLNRRGLSVYDWIMTEEEKAMVKKALDWAPGEMVDACTSEDAGDDDGKESKNAGKQKQKNEQNQKQNQQQGKGKQKNKNVQQNQSTQKQKKKKKDEEEEEEEEDALGFGNFFDEEVADEEKESSKANKKGKKSQNNNNNNNNNEQTNNRQNKQNKQNNKQDKKSNQKDSAEDSGPESFAVPLNFVAPQFEDPDYELLTAVGLMPFAVGVVEEKIREFYEEACEATLLFNRNLSVLSRAQALGLQAQFDRRMQALAKQKRQEWKETISRELVRKVYEGDDEKKGKLFSRWRPSLAEQRQPIPPPPPPQAQSIFRQGAAKHASQPRGHSRAMSVPEAVAPKEESHRMKNFLGKVARQVKFASSASDDEGLPPLIYRPVW